MRIVDFTNAHIEQAANIEKQNYETERRFVPALPPVDQWPDLKPFAKNNLGVAAFDVDGIEVINAKTEKIRAYTARRRF